MKEFNEGDYVVMIRTCTWWGDGPPFLKGTIGKIEQVGHMYAKFKGIRNARFELRNCHKIDPNNLTKLEKVIYEIKEE